MTWRPSSTGSVEATGAASTPSWSIFLPQRLSSRNAGNVSDVIRHGPKTTWLSSRLNSPLSGPAHAEYSMPDPCRASRRGSGSHRARVPRHRSVSPRLRRPRDTPARASPRRGPTHPPPHRSGCRPTAGTRRHPAEAAFTAGIVGADSRALLVQPPTQFDGARPPKRVGARLVGQAPHGHRFPGHVSQRLRQPVLGPLPMRVVARLHRREQVRRHAVRATELRRERRRLARACRRRRRRPATDRPWDRSALRTSVHAPLPSHPHRPARRARQSR